MVLRLSKYNLLLIIAGIFLTSAVIMESLMFRKEQAASLTARFERKLHRQQIILEEYLQQTVDILGSEEFDGNFRSSLNHLLPLYDEKGLAFLVAEGRNILFWSDNRVAFDSDNLTALHESDVVLLPNGVYVGEAKSVNNLSVIGLIHVKDVYSIRNRFMTNAFAKAFNLPDRFAVDKEHTAGGFPIHGVDGRYLFTLTPHGEIYGTATLTLLTSFLFVAVVLCLLFYLWVAPFMRVAPSYRWSLALVVSLLSLYLLLLLAGVPRVFLSLELFCPSLYAGHTLIPSLGHMLIVAVFIFFSGAVFARDFTYCGRRPHSEITAAFVGLAAFYLFIELLVRNLVYNSSFPFDFGNSAGISIYSVIAWIIIALLFYPAALISIRVTARAAAYVPKKTLLRIFVLLSAVMVTLSVITGNSVVYALCLFALACCATLLFQETQLEKVYMAYTVCFVAIFAVFSLLIISNYNNSRRQDIQKLRTVSLYSEHDPAAEIFLAGVYDEITGDTVIPQLLYPPYDELEEYIDNRYLNGYFRKYDLRLYVCDQSDSIFLQHEDRMTPCFHFFEMMIGESGIRIKDTEFFYMNYMNGRISYLGRFSFPVGADGAEVTMFMELQSKLVAEGIGFPELLIDRSMQTQSHYKPFSYAKYYDNTLVHIDGAYQYGMHFNLYDTTTMEGEFTFLRKDRYDHIVYHPGNRNYVVVSAPSFDFIDYLVTLPYVFVFYLAVSVFMLAIGSRRFRKLTFTYDLRFRIQAAIITVVFFSLLLVAAGTVWYNIRDYNVRYKNDLNEKLNAIGGDINMRLLDVEEFTPALQSWLGVYLSDLSNAFRTDITIYGLNGEIIATSRPEIISRGLISPRMNARVFHELKDKYQYTYIEPEKIGSLAFLSIYEPLVNNRGEYIGFINLPYFARSDEMKQDMSTFIVAFMNLYAFLFFASMLVAILLAKRITKPLSLIREKLKGIQLHKRSEQISYSGSDEIGALVQEYNRKVEELADSAELLARSERESAWREMAKQVAHEIKNPLTPMKLNIQYLQKAKEENNPYYDEYFAKVTRMLIEQIDTLSGIATEFSDFAKIPNAINEVFNLGDRLRQVVALFSSEQNIKFAFEQDEDEGDIFVYADEQQIARAVINLINNAIQSIPLGKTGMVTVKLSGSSERATIAVADNGTGIADEFRRFMFRPNFTTKSSGMGLGLAIVMKIADTCKGRVWYETEVGKGTVFFLELPRYVK